MGRHGHAMTMHHVCLMIMLLCIMIAQSKITQALCCATIALIFISTEEDS